MKKPKPEVKFCKWLRKKTDQCPYCNNPKKKGFQGKFLPVIQQAAMSKIEAF